MTDRINFEQMCLDDVLLYAERYATKQELDRMVEEIDRVRAKRMFGYVSYLEGKEKTKQKADRLQEAFNRINEGWLPEFDSVPFLTWAEMVETIDLGKDTVEQVVDVLRESLDAVKTEPETYGFAVAKEFIGRLEADRDERENG